MQANGCPQHNGESEETTSQQNGVCPSESGVKIIDNGNESGIKALTRTDQDIVRLIGQHLRGLGLK